MSEQVHDRELLGAYALGVLDPDEVHAVDVHISSCAECRQDLAGLREMKDSLGDVPPEAFLDGPPEGGDLLLQRTLREVRRANVHAARQRLALVAAGVVALVTVAAGAGVLAGRGSTPRHEVLPTAPATVPATVPATMPATAAPTTPPGVRTVSATDPKTGAKITATVTPAAGWVRVHADVGGVPAGKRCELVVVPRSGAPVVAGSWLVSPKGAKDGTSLDGSALVAVTDIAAVEVVTLDNEKLVSATV
jgi:anti-sigma factor RsiW